ncbi:hypothetical protein D9M72_498060 [compost metagenome]
MVSSSLGSSTSTFWKRRSSAASFSMYWRYSSRVVAPTQCNSPRASAGLSMLPASMAPSALPAPTMVCSSSMNRMTRPSCLDSSLSTPFRRSSNSPRNLAPAISAPISRASRRLSFRPSGTSPLTMRCARPSAMAVLPTPGSPISTGLFLVRRCRTWMVRRISSSRPITGSSLPSSARLVRSTVNLSSAWRDSSTLGSFTAWPPRRLAMAFSSALRVTPWPSRSLPRRVFSSIAASSTNSLEMNWSPFCWDRRSAWLSRRARSWDRFTSPVGFWIFGR